jgi:type II secretory pathway pseudopilin PulG
MNIKISNFFSGKKQSSRIGTTLIELVVAMGSGGVILGSMLCTALTISDTSVAISNYCDLNQASRNTLDTMSRDLRNTATVTSISDSQVTVSNVLTGDVISYDWDGSNDLTRTFDGTNSTVMLTECDYLHFSNYQRNPTNDFQFLPASTPAETKLISVSWRCSRQILGVKLDTESVQTAQICIRN